MYIYRNCLYNCLYIRTARAQVRFKNELERNITIKLGYANAKIYGRVLAPGEQARHARLSRPRRAR